MLTLNKQIIFSEQAPAAIGAYSQAVKVNNQVFVSGQIPLDPKTGQLISQDFEVQVHQVLRNLHAVVIAAGGTFEHIVRLTIYLIDMDKFTLVNQIMEKEFPKPFPARVSIGVASLPKQSQVEMDAILFIE